MDLIQYEQCSVRIDRSCDSELSLGKKCFSIQQRAELLRPVVVRHKTRYGPETASVAPCQNHAPAMLFVSCPMHSSSSYEEFTKCFELNSLLCRGSTSTSSLVPNREEHNEPTVTDRGTPVMCSWKVQIRSSQAVLCSSQLCFVLFSRNCLSTMALLYWVSCALNTKVTRSRRTRASSGSQAVGCFSSSRKYRRRNSSHFVGSLLRSEERL